MLIEDLDDHYDAKYAARLGGSRATVESENSDGTVNVTIKGRDFEDKVMYVSPLGRPRAGAEVLLRWLGPNSPIIVAELPESWNNVSSFSNSWVNYDSDRVAQYRRVGDEVQLRGMIKDGTVTAAAFTLPSGYRPPDVLGTGGNVYHLPCASNTAFGEVRIDADGNVIPYAGNNTYFDLSSLRFSVVEWS